MRSWSWDPIRSQAVNVGLAVKGLVDLCRGGDSSFKFQKEQIDKAAREEKEEANVLKMMTTQEEGIRSSSPTTCEKVIEIADRIMLKHSLNAPAETTLRLLETYQKTIAQCGSKCPRRVNV